MNEKSEILFFFRIVKIKLWVYILLSLCELNHSPNQIQQTKSCKADLNIRVLFTVNQRQIMIMLQGKKIKKKIQHFYYYRSSFYLFFSAHSGRSVFYLYLFVTNVLYFSSFASCSGFLLVTIWWWLCLYASVQFVWGILVLFLGRVITRMHQKKNIFLIL